MHDHFLTWLFPRLASQGRCPRLRNRFLLVLAVFAGVTSALYAQGPPAAVPVEVARVIRDDVSSSGDYVATVVPTRRTIVGTAVDGRVESFLLDPDLKVPDANLKVTRVVKNQILAQLKTDTVESELEAARAELALRRAELEELENGSRPEEIATAKAQLERWQASRDYTKSRLRRLQTLFDSNSSVSLDKLEETRSEATQAEQAFHEAQSQYDLAVSGPRAEVIAQAKARVTAQEHTVERMEGIVRKYSVRSPFDGYVVAEYTEVGAWVKSGDPVAEVVQLRPIEVEANVPEKYIPDIRVQDAAKITLNAMPGREFQGTVERIIPQADVRSRTFPIRVRMPDSLDPEKERIFAGMLGHVSLTTEDSENALLVPKDALVLGGQQPRVMVVQADSQDGAAVPTGNDSSQESATGVVHAVGVTLGVTRGSLIQIRGEINPGDRVVTRGNERLREGQLVTWKEPSSK
ncbi:MAG: efflux RND transporter periplasmic adaptor subunit [Planctomycetales bacterium]|nr:efflux RND transporter periplasmic adaptor subunit [Planctomycetales bacterium]